MDTLNNINVIIQALIQVFYIFFFFFFLNFFFVCFRFKFVCSLNDLLGSITGKIMYL